MPEALALFLLSNSISPTSDPAILRRIADLAFSANVRSKFLPNRSSKNPELSLVSLEAAEATFTLGTAVSSTEFVRWYRFGPREDLSAVSRIASLELIGTKIPARRRS